MMKREFRWIPVLACAAVVWGAENEPAVAVEVVKVAAERVERRLQLPAELGPYEAVDIYPRVSGFIERIEVDRGSWVKRGQLLVTMTAPELGAQRAEAEARVQSLEAQRAEAAAKLAGLESTYQRLKDASATPGVVAGNDLILAEKTAEAERARGQSIGRSIAAAQEAVRALRDMEAYLRIEAPFDGVVTERNAHPGALAGPAAGANGRALLRIEQITRLRLVVPVPEAEAESIVPGTRASFTVPAYPGVQFTGVVRRPAYSLEAKTRSMPVELDVENASRRLAPGMFADVTWPARRRAASLLVPPSAIVATTERIFVIRVRDGAAEWVDVRRGSAVGPLVEIFGDLKDGDAVVRRGTDEIRPGTRLTARAAQ
jgi:membrane fusion protein (multidrug efflux system)